MSKVFIHQPEYFPWLNFFIKASISDIFIILDDVQYVRRSFQNRNKIKTSFGAKWLTVPLKYSPQKTPINKVLIDNDQNWQNKHYKLIRENYKLSPYFDEVSSIIMPIFVKKWKLLENLNSFILKEILKNMNINCKIVKSSELNISSKKNELILDLCSKVKAKEYVVGTGSKSYLKEKDFISKGIKITYVEKKIKYNQICNPKKFIPDLSIIDFLYSKGFSKNF